ncbi:MAG: SDR family NAD(P)-dependent oxidoreductase [Verrucomicrobia bacterium]|nr:SDR family NAD(P)-dependent oxidoreductase [Verrucomicrobiota bacterium]
MPSRLANQWVLITGASSGFGAAAAVAFGAEGARLLLGARRVERLANVAAEAKRAGATAAEFHALDVASTESVETFVQWVRTLTPRVDVLINNAGGAHGLEPVAEGHEADWRAMMEINVLGLLRMTRAVLPLMVAHPGGTILNIGSIAGRVAYEGGAAYCASKAGELQITRALRLELCGTGLRVGTIDPGFAETEFSLVRFKGDAARASKVYEGVNPLTAGDVAEAMVWAASRPPHVCIDEMLIKATDQAAIHKVHRRPTAAKSK